MFIVIIVFEIIGALGLLLYGMKLMSDGIQRSAGDGLHRILNFMTGNRVAAVLTGLGITAIIQSSSATTVMTVSFVNAGLLTLTQSIGVIFGANIGTTITAWIVSLVGFKFKLAIIAVPVFGVGYFMTFFKGLKKDGLGEAFMGFGLLFLGLELLGKAIPSVSADQVSFLAYFTDHGFLGLLVGVMAGMILTMLVHSSSAATAIVLTMSHNGLLTWEFAAAMVLGSNIGTTIDAVLAAIGTKLNARRAAAVHVLFNVTGTFVAMIFFRPFLTLVDFVVPGAIDGESITTHLAMLHTLFNTINTLIFLPFVNQIARLVESLITPGDHEPPAVYRLDFPLSGLTENAESFVFRAEREVAVLSDVVRRMFALTGSIIEDPSSDKVQGMATDLRNQENFADEMREELVKYLDKTERLPLSEKAAAKVRRMTVITVELESASDNVATIGALLGRRQEKHLEISGEDIDRLKPCLAVVGKFLDFVHENLNQELGEDKLETARLMEEQIDAFRKNLKKVARKRLEDGANVKAELLYLDIVRNMEKIGDHAYTISEALASSYSA